MHVANDDQYSVTEIYISIETNIAVPKQFSTSSSYYAVAYEMNILKTALIVKK